jgi:small subunit ribosomal protein S5
MVKDFQKSDGFLEKLVNIKRHSKTVKGGRIMSFSALVIVGNGNGKVGMGRGKSREVPVAMQKALENARHNMIDVSLNGTTLWYCTVATHGATKVFMHPASEGTGIIAGNAMRSVLEMVGIHNVLTKVYGSTNAINVVRATIKALVSLESPEEIAERRGFTVEEIKG